METTNTAPATNSHPAYAVICPACQMAPGIRCEDTQGLECAPHLSRLVAQVSLDQGVVVGNPWILSAICRHLGFSNPCAKGRVFLTSAKLRFLGLEVR